MASELHSEVVRGQHTNPFLSGCNATSLLLVSSLGKQGYSKLTGKEVITTRTAKALEMNYSEKIIEGGGCVPRNEKAEEQYDSHP